MGRVAGTLVGDGLRRSVQRFADKTALVFGNDRITYRDLNARANRVANALLGIGVRKGDRVALLSKNSSEYLVIRIGLAKCGAVLIPLNCFYVARELLFVMNDCAATVLIFTEEYSEMVSKLRAEMPHVETYICVGERLPPDSLDYTALISTAPSDEPAVDLSEDDDLEIMYTSGTTGRPKGAIATHRARVQMAVNCIIDYSIQEDDITLMAMPLFHVSGINMTFQTHITVGATAVLLPRFDPLEVLRAIEREKVTQMTLVPTMMHAILQHPDFDRYELHSLKKITHGGSPMPGEMVLQMLQKLRWVAITHAYGSTEGAQMTVLKPRDYMAHLGQTGRPLINVDLRLVDEAGRDVAVGEVGEIVTRGPHVVRGYLNRPDANAECFRDGWFYTGDMARQEPDGYLTIIDRRKDMIISGGENVYPSEIEEVLYCHPMISECAVFGIPDEKWVEAVCAAVVVKAGCELTVEEVFACCRTSLAPFKRPKRVLFMERLPQTESGKINKAALRAPFWEGTGRKI